MKTVTDPQKEIPVIYEADMVNNVMPYDIPYRCLVPKSTDGLLSAGSAMSTDFIVGVPPGIAPPVSAPARRRALQPPLR